MRYIRKMRRRVSDPFWRQRKLRRLAELYGQNERFYHFQCSEHFKGKHLARMNREIYNRERVKLDRQIAFLERLDAEASNG